MANELSLITPVNDTFRRDVEVASATLIDPNDALALTQGEWVVSNASGKFVRVSSQTLGAFQVFTQRGDTSAQAIGKIAVLQLHEYEAETTQFADAITPAIGTALALDAVTIDGVTNRSGFRVAITGDYVYAFVTKASADNGGKLRYQTARTAVILP